jgi:hypothetical protein
LCSGLRMDGFARQSIHSIWIQVHPDNLWIPKAY